jgi:phosphatidylglycerophosphate synthase
MYRLRGGTERDVSDRYFTAPNAITSLGLVGCGLYAVLLLAGNTLWLLPLLHVEIFMSDALDGFVADLLDQHSRLGKTLDPIRDRLHGFLVLMTLSLYDSTAMIIAAAAIAAELSIGALAFAKHLREVHVVGKLRATVYWIAGLVGLAELFWFKIEYVPLSVCTAAMACASVCALIVYARVPDRPSADHRYRAF